MLWRDISSADGGLITSAPKRQTPKANKASDLTSPQERLALDIQNPIFIQYVIFHKENLAWELELWEEPIALDADAMAAMPARALNHGRPRFCLFAQSLVRPFFFEGERLATPQRKEVKGRAAKALFCKSKIENLFSKNPATWLKVGLDLTIDNNGDRRKQRGVQSPQ